MSRFYIIDLYNHPKIKLDLLNKYDNIKNKTYINKTCTKT